MNYRQRQTAARQRLERAGLEGLLVAHLPNIRYLTGFSGSNGLLLLTPRRAELFTDGRYREQAAQEVEAARVRIPARGDLWKAAARAAARLARVGFESDRVTVAQRAHWLEHWPGKPAGFKPARGWIEAQRAIKEPEEIEAITRAVRLAASAFEPALRRLRPGMLETELAGWLEFELRKAGSEGLAFETIVASGARGARVHGHPAAQPVARHGFMVMDYGVILAGYASDMTRTVHLGRPDARAREIYQVVRAAQAAAAAAVRPGARAAAVDRAARRVIAEAGYGAFFPHSTGHGVGLEVHEAPRLGAGSKEKLAAGQTITIEPGIYIPGWGGVRIEDVVVVTAGGAETLTPTPKEMLTL